MPHRRRPAGGEASAKAVSSWNVAHHYHRKRGRWLLVLEELHRHNHCDSRIAEELTLEFDPDWWSARSVRYWRLYLDLPANDSDRECGPLLLARATTWRQGQIARAGDTCCPITTRRPQPVNGSNQATN